MTTTPTSEIIKHSVTSDDTTKHIEGSGTVQMFLPFLSTRSYDLPLPTELPPYWTVETNGGFGSYFNRDTVLRSTILKEAHWADAVSIASTKAASMSFDLDGPPETIKRFQSMLIDWGGDGYVPSQERGILDYLTTDNGEFWEIVRVSNARGSRIIGLVHLDSLRCVRTGDPSIPVIFRDLRGGFHELKDYQVMSLVDQPDAGTASLGIGHCAAERAYDNIFLMHAARRYVIEKVTGAGANALHFVQGMNDKQLKSVVESAESQSQAKGQIYYQGNILIGTLSQMPIETKTIKLRGLPDGFDYDKLRDDSLLTYANSIGLVLTDLQPLSGQGLGTGAQSVVLEEKATGRGLASRRKHLTHLLNQWILPDTVTFSFSENDLREESTEADISKVRADTRSVQIASGEISQQEARHMAAESDDIPNVFIEDDPIEDQVVGDEGRVDTDGGGQALGDRKPGDDEEGSGSESANATPTQLALPGLNGDESASTSNALRATVGGSAQIMELQLKYYDGDMPRDAALNNVIMLFGFSLAEAEKLFLEIEPDPPGEGEEDSDEPPQPNPFVGLPPVEPDDQEVKMVSKSIDDVVIKYSDRLANLVDSAISGKSSAVDLRRGMKSLIRSGIVQDGFTEGMLSGGASLPVELDQDDLSAIATWKSEQVSFVDKFAKAAADVSGIKNKAEREAAESIINGRREQWDQSFESLIGQGKSSIIANAMGTWRRGRTKEGCATCIRLDGTRHRVKWFTSRNFIPQSNGASMECKGMKCRCRIIGDNRRRLLPVGIIGA